MAADGSSSKDITQGDIPRSRPWVKKVLIAGVVLLVLGISGMAGFFIWRATRSSAGAGAPALNTVELPPPGSPAAKALLAHPTTSDSIRALYQAAEDANNIKPKDVEAFLARLQAQLSTIGYDMDLTQFSDLANQVVLLLRQARADALLSLLRHWTQTGTLALESTDQDQLQREVNSVLQPSAWDTYFRFTSARDASSSPIKRDWDNAFPDKRTAAAPTGVPAESAAAVTSTVAAAAAAASPPPQQGAGRRLLLHPAVEHGPRHNTTAWRRKLAAAADIPVITASSGGAGASAGPLPTLLPPQTLQDMLCSIAPFAGKPVDTSKCRPRPTGRYSHAGLTFKPVTIPLVFHLMRYADSSGKRLPLYSDPVADATHLVAATNEKYQGTGITFSLKEVRVDPVRHPYLMLSYMDWLDCAPSEHGPGVDCLGKLMQAHADDSYAINVIVTGAALEMELCTTPAARSLCQAAYLGFCNARGPWFPSWFALPEFNEDAADLNWVHVTYEYISPAHLNAASKDDGGAATLAHELGHYLGLRHTHEGARECEGDGVGEADAVPDTPMNKDVQATPGGGLKGVLGQFCTNWRKGKPTDANVLRRFNSCDRPGPDAVDNVFNIMSYMPDACFFMFTENQVARMQWAMVNFRPKLMARYAA